MKALPSLLTAAALALPAASATAAVTVIGDSQAASCFHSAERAQLGDASVDECTAALADHMLSERDVVATRVNRGILHMLRQEDALANQDFDVAATLDPTEPEAYLNKGLLRLRQGNGVEAMPLIAQAMDHRTARPELAFYARGVANEINGNLRAAYADLKMAQSLSPRWAVPAQELARFRVISR